MIYPEGHRNLSPDPLPLRSGMLRYAYTRGLLVQIFIGHGYDRMLNQHSLTASWSKTKVHYYMDQPIDARDYPYFDQFRQAVQDRFTQLFYEVKAQASKH